MPSFLPGEYIEPLFFCLPGLTDKYGPILGSVLAGAAAMIVSAHVNHVKGSPLIKSNSTVPLIHALSVRNEYNVMQVILIIGSPQTLCELLV